jgi:hypothetical protein
MNLTDLRRAALDCQKAKGRPGLSVWSRDDAGLDELTKAGLSDTSERVGVLSLLCGRIADCARR